MTFSLLLEYADRVAVIKEGEKILEIGVEADRIVDFQTGNYTQREILEMFNTDQKNNLIIGLILREL